MLFVYLQVACAKTIRKVFYYTGTQQTMQFYRGCNYTVSLWGGDGGLGYYKGTPYNGGAGAYVSAFVKLKKTMNVTIMVGGAGEDGEIGSYYRPQGGWNGGGNAGRDAPEGGGQAGEEQSGAGGGSTDIRLLDSFDINTLKSRLLIAGGGSGAAGGFPGAPGGKIGYHYYYTPQVKPEVAKVSKNGGGGTNIILEGGQGGDNANTAGGGGGGGEYGGIGGIGSYRTSYQNVGHSGSSGITDKHDDVEKVTLIECLTYKDVPTKESAGDGVAIITFEKNEICKNDDAFAPTNLFTKKPNPKPKRNKSFSIGIFTGIASRI